jgi:Ca2+/Na+ antiporter
MKMANIKEIKGKITEVHKKALILGPLMAGLGGAVGGYISAKTGNHTYAGAGAAIGSILGISFAFIMRKKMRLERLFSIQAVVLILLSILSLLMATAGIIVFFLKDKKVGLTGAIFFGVCCLVFLWKIKQTKAE